MKKHRLTTGGPRKGKSSKSNKAVLDKEESIFLGKETSFERNQKVNELSITELRKERESIIEYSRNNPQFNAFCSRYIQNIDEKLAELEKSVYREKKLKANVGNYTKTKPMEEKKRYRTKIGCLVMPRHTEVFKTKYKWPNKDLTPIFVDSKNRLATSEVEEIPEPKLSDIVKFGDYLISKHLDHKAVWRFSGYCRNSESYYLINCKSSVMYIYNKKGFNDSYKLKNNEKEKI